MGLEEWTEREIVRKKKKKKTILLESRDVWIGQFSKDDKRVLNLESVVKNAKRG